jgi:hypothetical protein
LRYGCAVDTTPVATGFARLHQPGQSMFARPQAPGSRDPDQETHDHEIADRLQVTGVARLVVQPEA